MKLTIGMPSYHNSEQVWWTIQALRLYHDLTDCEIVVVDNVGDEKLKNLIASNNYSCVRYEQFTEKRGTAPAKQRIFEMARGDFVLCIDSHVMLFPNAIDDLKKFILRMPDTANLFQGPMYYDCLINYVDRMNPRWETNFFGVWGPNMQNPPLTSYEIPMHGMGLFGCMRDKWLGFNPEFRGFGGEEGYIHEKYRIAGHKIILLPFLKWVHRFHDQVSEVVYPNITEERIRNYVIGWDELGLDKTEMTNFFGLDAINKALKG